MRTPVSDGGNAVWFNMAGSLRWIFHEKMYTTFNLFLYM